MPSPMSVITLSAPAKINLCLRITGRRSDGYHLLESIMAPLTLADDLRIESVWQTDSQGLIRQNFKEWRDEAGGNGIFLRCGHPEVPCDDTNLCGRAAQAMRAAAGRTDAIAVDLTKRIPIGGGLGGGSSDAAAVLHGLNRLWDLGWSPKRLAEIGVSLGADVPFFCYGRAAHVRGIGEDILVHERFPKLWILLVNPGFSVSTPWAYQAYDLRLTGFHPHGRSLPPFFEGFEEVTAICANDLEAAVAERYPEIGAIKAALSRLGAKAVAMSGSGATVFGVFASQAARDAAVNALRSSEWLVIPTESREGGSRS